MAHQEPALGYYVKVLRRGWTKEYGVIREIVEDQKHPYVVALDNSCVVLHLSAHEMKLIAITKHKDLNSPSKTEGDKTTEFKFKKGDEVLVTVGKDCYHFGTVVECVPYACDDRFFHIKFENGTYDYYSESNLRLMVGSPVVSKTTTTTTEKTHSAFKIGDPVIVNSKYPILLYQNKKGVVTGLSGKGYIYPYQVKLDISKTTVHVSETEIDICSDPPEPIFRVIKGF